MSLTDEFITIVIFRVWRNGGGVLALFPRLPGTRDLATCDSCEHVGQHGAATYVECIRASRPAWPKEYASLKRELEAIGYRLEVHQRASRQDHTARREEARR